MTIQQIRNKAIELLKKTSPSAELDADVLLQSILNCDKTFLLFHRETELSAEQESVFNSCIEKRITGLPVAYITGHKEFYGIDFLVNPNVLIPKPDTEILVEETLKILEDKAAAENSDSRIITICDMCTGSGCVGLTVLNQCEEQKIFSRENLPSVLLADISDKALSTAQQNASRKEVLSESAQKRVRLARSNLFENIHGTFDIITANPPYIPLHMVKELLKDGRNEPALALNGDVDVITGNPSSTSDGLAIMRELVSQAYDHLAPGGVLLVEAGEYNAMDTEIIFVDNFFRHTKIIPDLEGQLRVIKGTKI